MKRQRISGFFNLTSLLTTPEFIFLTTIFLCGCIAGSVAGMSGSESTSQLAGSLFEALKTPLQNLQWGNVILATMAWPLAVIVCGLLPPPGLFVAAVVGWRGFVLAFSVSVVLMQFQMQGVWISLRAFGLQALIAVPCLLAVAAAAFYAAQNRPRSGRFSYFYVLDRFRGSVITALILSMLSVSLRFLLPVGI